MELKSQFDVADHIGCIAAAAVVLIRANWDGRDFYSWTTRYALSARSPTLRERLPGLKIRWPTPGRLPPSLEAIS